MYKCQITFIKNQDIYLLKSYKVIFRFLLNLQRLNKITKNAKSINLKTD